MTFTELAYALACAAGEGKRQAEENGHDYCAREDCPLCRDELQKRRLAAIR